MYGLPGVCESSVARSRAISIRKIAGTLNLDVTHRGIDMIASSPRELSETELRIVCGGSLCTTGWETLGAGLGSLVGAELGGVGGAIIGGSVGAMAGSWVADRLCKSTH